MRQPLLALASFAVLAASASAQTYVGSYRVQDGAAWDTNPQVYSAQEAAALLFGGAPTDYAISINPSISNPSTITHTGYYSPWGLECGVFPEGGKVDQGASGYDDPGGINTARSAYVDDNCFEDQTNYVWRVQATPLKATPVPGLGLLGLLSLSAVLGGVGFGLKHRSG
ncbi:PEP-CTERM sorting domain-containing protein [Comamonas sp. JUb58]|uniref:PEP-CTERM sorting domain-containing protein n=1 Tax=Comamonas sp. JUb58 TaxID=2485114 RepID=UPI001060DD1F|nr:PEP-CTERM sorting domain-containing protein [Comamonas sp. JUb58]TDS83922.1 hypothetical protein EDF71_10341 [Comamonas sp. JUb58]